MMFVLERVGKLYLSGSIRLTRSHRMGIGIFGGLFALVSIAEYWMPKQILILRLPWR